MAFANPEGGAGDNNTQTVTSSASASANGGAGVGIGVGGGGSADGGDGLIIGAGGAGGDASGSGVGVGVGGAGGNAAAFSESFNDQTSATSRVDLSAINISDNSNNSLINLGAQGSSTGASVAIGLNGAAGAINVQAQSGIGSTQQGAVSVAATVNTLNVN